MIRRIIEAGSLVLMLVAMQGCAVKASEAPRGGTFWGSEKMIRRVDVGFDSTVEAVRAGLESLALDITKESIVDNAAQFRSNYTDGKTMWIEVRKLSESKSYIGVRVGMITDEEASKNILDTIQEYL